MQEFVFASQSPAIWYVLGILGLLCAIPIVAWMQAIGSYNPAPGKTPKLWHFMVAVPVLLIIVYAIFQDIYSMEVDSPTVTLHFMFPRFSKEFAPADIRRINFVEQPDTGFYLEMQTGDIDWYKSALSEKQTVLAAVDKLSEVTGKKIFWLKWDDTRKIEMDERSVREPKLETP